MASDKCSDGGSASSPAIGIKIPLSELFGSEASSEQTETVTCKYKLINGCPSRREIRKKKSYVLSYNRNTRNAEWVYEILNKDTLREIKNNIQCKSSRFFYIKGYDQGHLAAAANHGWCQEAYNETFLFSNMSPQLSKLNRGMWKYLEGRCRNNVTDKIRNIHLYTGPIIKAKSKDPSASVKAVPDSFFKVIIEENRDGTVSEPIGYLITNDKTTLLKDVKDKVDDAMPMDQFVEIKYKTSVEDIEKVSKLNFCIRDVQMVNEEIRSVNWTGEDREGESCSARIEVRIGEQLQEDPVEAEEEFMIFTH